MLEKQIPHLYKDIFRGDPSGVLCVLHAIDRSKRLRYRVRTRDFTVPKCYRTFWAASPNPRVLIPDFFTKIKNEATKRLLRFLVIHRGFEPRTP